MDFLNRSFKSEPNYQRLLSCTKSGNLPIATSGLSDIHKALVVANLAEDTGKKILIITPSDAVSSALKDDLSALGVTALGFPSRDLNLFKADSHSKEYEHSRIHTLSRVLDGAFDVLVASVDACVQHTLSPHLLKQSRLRLCSKDTVNLSSLCEKLIDLGYTRSDLCEGAGQFSSRGGILDIFAIGMDYPVRIELWGDEIDTLSAFDPISQRRTDNIDELNIFPCFELPYNPQELAEKLQKYLKSSKTLTELQRENILKDIEKLQNKVSVSPDLYLPFLYEKQSTVFDYFEDAIVCACESGNIKDRIKSIFALQSEDVKLLLENGVLSRRTANLRLDAKSFWGNLGRAIYLENFPRSSYEISLAELVHFDFKRISAWNGDLALLCEDVSDIIATNQTLVILAGETKGAKVLCQELCDRGFPATLISTDSELKKGLYVATGGLSSGFQIPKLSLNVITRRHISNEGKILKRKIKGAKEIGSLDELSKGDYVVHASHGIGIFDGINRITNQGVTKDYIKIKYAGTDVLYVPVTQLDLVSKYIGAATEEKTIKLNRLGGTEWHKTRSRVKAAVKNMAKELTSLYAKRLATKGYAFSPDTDLQNNFERRFEYEETEDQLRCINEIKADMQREVPMDRLLCGDVGFGKTEVALRAAFKCISEGKQCALLVPTTILASQHYNTILNRFGDMPVNVRLLNRFVSKKEQENTVKGLKSGRIDMVVGTHRLISNDVTFKNIGLVIIDEEQRFGVAQKEKLKKMYPFVDILTLSATPIPRTLNMAMSGLRDMSSIDEAPGDRYPVQTYVLEENRGVLIEAISKELRRGGQVYYMHNRVESIVSCAAKLKDALPSARIGIAHGKMSENELAEVWKKLVEHEIDVLVCTSIIETGVDVPNANTLIVENADRLGLSQLHQLRGRVGRSPRRAYAYFCFKPYKNLSEVASKRLEAIRQFTEFGSGFKIALRDLEIRGAGSILGGEQHGNMEAVGYDMYLKLLSDAVAEQNGEPTPTKAECTIDINISAFIPEGYINSLPARLGIYKRIADISDLSDSSDVIDELCDRFGEPPKSVLALIDIALLRNKAAAAGIKEITETPVSLLLHCDAINEITASKLAEKFGDAFSVSVIGAPKYVISTKGGLKVNEIITAVSKVL